jgi:GT2 family glycosyltransferase/glycosyltransferase involved in cell wall biosynthesis
VQASIIIPVHNRADLTRQCLETICQNTPADIYEIVVVDNASADGTSELLKEWGGRLRSIQNTTNLGFGVACNQGAGVAVGEFLVFLNNDTEPQPGWLETCLDVLRQDLSVGIVGSKLLYPDGTVQHAGIEFVKMSHLTVCGVPVHRLRSQRGDDLEVNQKTEVHAISGACMFIRRTLFVEVGGFCEDYGMYFEDVDLNLKVRRLGRKVVYEPRSVVVHHEAKSWQDQQKSNQQMIRAANIFYHKWSGELERILSRMGALRMVDTGPLGELGILWDADFLGWSAASSVAVSLVLGLVLEKVHVQSSVLPAAAVAPSDPGLAECFAKMSELKVNRNVCIISGVSIRGRGGFATRVGRNAGYTYYIGYMNCDADCVPSFCVEDCTHLDEVWVPYRFQRDVFEKSGVPREKLQVVPCGVDVNLFDPERVKPLEISGRKAFNFLAVFSWEFRKGWDILLRAYLQAFTSGDDVSLVIHVTSTNSRQTRQTITDFLVSLGRKIADAPTILVSDRPVAYRALPGLYRNAEAVVAPSRAVGWSRTCLEGMAMALPVIATRWGGNLELMNDTTGYLVDCETVAVPEAQSGGGVTEREAYRGTRWAEPSVSETARKLREVFEHREEAQRRGRCAREHIVKRFSSRVSAQVVIQNLRRIGVSETYQIRNGTSRNSPFASA